MRLAKITTILPYTWFIFHDNFSNFYFQLNTYLLTRCCYQRGSSELNIVTTIHRRTVSCQFGDRKSLRTGSVGVYSQCIRRYTMALRWGVCGHRFEGGLALLFVADGYGEVRHAWDLWPTESVWYNGTHLSAHVQDKRDHTSCQRYVTTLFIPGSRWWNGSLSVRT